MYDNDMDDNLCIDYLTFKFNAKYLAEYFSERYREYVYNLENLKERDIELVKLIKEIKK